jgi:hypothetical protein
MLLEVVMAKGIIKINIIHTRMKSRDIIRSQKLDIILHSLKIRVHTKAWQAVL